MKNSFRFLYCLVMAIALYSSVYYSCINDSPEIAIPGKSAMSSRAGEAVGGPQGAGSPCDSPFYFRPVAWGNPLFPIPQTLTSGKRGNVNWWQVKLDASNYIPPTKYKQGVPPNWERIVVADSFVIKGTDTFYLCSKVWK